MRRPAHGEGGFLLVGVVIFVLALAILGMSLYSLSSYEAGFQMDSRESDTAFFDAQAGLVMVQAVLAGPTARLSDAQNVVGHRGITYVVAKQRRSANGWDSTGAINWDSTMTVTVLAQVGGGSHLLTARYIPKLRNNPYKRLFTVSGTGPGVVLVPTSVNGLNRFQTFRVNNRASDGWLNTTDTLALANNLDWDNRSWFKIGGVPDPDAQGFYAEHAIALQPPAWTGAPPNQQMTLGTGPGEITYYMSRDPGDYSFDALTGGTIKITGTVVWMFPRGIRSWSKIHVKQAAGNAPPASVFDEGGGPGGGGSTTLVLVGSPNADRASEPEIGVYLRGGLDVDSDINVILVSDGMLELSHLDNYTDALQAERLSIYCNRLRLVGPDAGSNVVSDLDYTSDMDAVIDDLQSQDALPRGIGTLPTLFTMIKGSWRDLTP